MSFSFPTPDWDLISPDGAICSIEAITPTTKLVTVEILHISPHFVGFHIDPSYVFFNLKSTLAQLGLQGVGKEYYLSLTEKRAYIKLELQALNSLGKALLAHLTVGAFIGKLFAADPLRKVRNPDYLLRMFHRFDSNGLPLLSLGNEKDSCSQLKVEKVDGYTLAFLPLLQGVVEYEPAIIDFFSTLALALHHPHLKTRVFLPLHQKWCPDKNPVPKDFPLLLARTQPLYIRTVFAKVVESQLPKGVFHTSASVLQPNTKASGDIYELFGSSSESLIHIPLEFYTLEPYKEHVFFSDRDQLKNALSQESTIFQAFETAPSPPTIACACFIVKSDQLLHLSPALWNEKKQTPSITMEEQMKADPCYPFLRAIEKGDITSQGVLFSKYFPPPLMKKLLLNDLVQECLKRIYFQSPSLKYGDFFSHEDRTFLLDLAKCGIAVFWADKTCQKLLQFAFKPEREIGMFVPPSQVKDYINSTSFGVYGSSLIHLSFEEELFLILQGILQMQQTLSHPLLNPQKPLSLTTGGGPGLMEVGNRVAKKLGILSCANIVDLRGIEQRTNPYIEAKMTYRIDNLVERQGEFNLDFPIFLMGGFGTDFEFALEAVRRKVEIKDPTPVLLLGPKAYWKGKISSLFITNQSHGTIVGSEWVSNCFYAVSNAKEALEIYRRYFSGTLPIGKKHPPASEGFFSN